MRKMIVSFLLVFIITMFFGYVIWHPEIFGLCGITDKVCIYNYPIFSIGKPLFFASLGFSVVFLVLAVAPTQSFRAWRWFGYWFIPVAIGMILYTDTQGRREFIPTLDRTNVTIELMKIYVIISLLIILISWGVEKWRKSVSNERI